MFIVYVLKSGKDGRLYVGLTKDLNKRIAEHNSGKMKSTKGFVPWKLVYKETFGTRIEARKREKYFKSGIGKTILKEYLQHKAS